MTAAAVWETPWFTFAIASDGTLWPVVRSLEISLLQMVALKLVISVCKKAFSDDEHELWCFLCPTLTLCLELGQCMLFLIVKFGHSQFWALFSLPRGKFFSFRNTGCYLRLYVLLREKFRRSESKHSIKLMEERSAVLGPCGNVAEIASPIMILIAISDAKLASRR